MDEEPSVQKAVNVKERMPTKEGVLQFRLVFAKIALHLLSKGGRNKVDTHIRSILDNNPDTGQPRRHVKRTDDFKPVMDESTDQELAGEGFMTHILRIGSTS